MSKKVRFFGPSAQILLLSMFCTNKTHSIMGRLKSISLASSFKLLNITFESVMGVESILSGLLSIFWLHTYWVGTVLSWVLEVIAQNYLNYFNTVLYVLCLAHPLSRASQERLVVQKILWKQMDSCHLGRRGFSGRNMKKETGSSFSACTTHTWDQFWSCDFSQSDWKSQDLFLSIWGHRDSGPQGLTVK